MAATTGERGAAGRVGARRSFAGGGARVGTRSGGYEVVSSVDDLVMWVSETARPKIGRDDRDVLDGEELDTVNDLKFIEIFLDSVLVVDVDGMVDTAVSRGPASFFCLIPPNPNFFFSRVKSILSSLVYLFTSITSSMSERR